MECGIIFCLLVLIICQVSCDENTELMFSQIDGINEEMTDMRSDMARLEEKIMRKIDFAKAAIRSELKQRVKNQVRKAMAEILQGESIEEMVTSQVVSEVRKLKQEHHQLKRQLHQVVKSVRDVQEDRETYKESPLKTERNASEFLMCCKYVVDSKTLQSDLEQCNKESNERNKENQELIRNMISLNETCQLPIPKVNISFDVTTSVESLSNSTVMTTLPTTTPKLQLQKVNISSDVTTYVQTLLASTVTTTLPTTTPKPEEERSRFVIAPLWSSTQNQFHQLNIHSHTLKSYPYLSLKYVLSLAYVSRLKKLLIALANPNKIISSSLDSYGVKTMRKSSGSFGMAVDEDRELVFMTTHSPRKSISRMTTHGKHFTTISNLSNYSYPYAIAIDSKDKTIYICDSSKVLMIPYNGHYVQTLATGSGIRALALDNTAGILYYNDDKRLMKLSLSNNVSSNVTTLSVYPWSMIEYNNTVYFSGGGYYDTYTIGAVGVRYDISYYTLKTINQLGGFALMLCLVP